MGAEQSHAKQARRRGSGSVESEDEPQTQFEEDEDIDVLETVEERAEEEEDDEDEKTSDGTDDVVNLETSKEGEETEEGQQAFVEETSGDDSHVERTVLYNLRQIHRAEGRGDLYHRCMVRPPKKAFFVLSLCLVGAVCLVVLPFFLIALLLIRVIKPKRYVENLPYQLIDLLGMQDIDFCNVIETKANPIEPKHAVEQVQQTIRTRLPWEGFPVNLDYGIYWFGKGGGNCSKGPSSMYFLKSKPSVIYVHGWEPDGVVLGFRETINWRVSDPKVIPAGVLEEADCIDVWINKGYNVGVFYWDQFSDEVNVSVAERKIYNASWDKRGMRWRKRNLDGSTVYVQSSANTHCAADLLVMELRKHFEFDMNMMDIESWKPPPLVHLVGHSLGAQLALEGYRRLVLTQHKYKRRVWLPERVTLLDPFFSGGKKKFAPFFRTKVTDRVRETLSVLVELPFDVALETYVTSMIGSGHFGAKCKLLKSHTKWKSVHVAFAPFVDVGFRHVITPHLYFSSLLEDEDSRDAFQAYLEREQILASTKRTSHRSTLRSQAQVFRKQNSTSALVANSLAVV